MCVRVGPLSAGPGAVSAAAPPSHAGQPNEPTLMGLQLHCSTAYNTQAHTLQGGGGITVPASDRTERELMGHHFVQHCHFQFADLMSHRALILALTVFTGTGRGMELIPDMIQ